MWDGTARAIFSAENRHTVVAQDEVCSVEWRLLALVIAPPPPSNNTVGIVEITGNWIVKEQKNETMHQCIK